MADFRIENHGSLSLCRPLNGDAREHLRDNVGDEAQFLGDACAVEPRYVDGLVEGLIGNGYEVE